MRALRAAVLIVCLAAWLTAPPARAAQPGDCYVLADFAYRVGHLIVTADLTRADALAAVRGADLTRDRREVLLRITGYVYDSEAAPWDDAGAVYKACGAGQLEKLLGARL